MSIKILKKEDYLILKINDNKTYFKILKHELAEYIVKRLKGFTQENQIMFFVSGMISTDALQLL